MNKLTKFNVKETVLIIGFFVLMFFGPFLIFFYKFDTFFTFSFLFLGVPYVLLFTRFVFTDEEREMARSEDLSEYI